MILRDTSQASNPNKPAPPSLWRVSLGRPDRDFAICAGAIAALLLFLFPRVIFLGEVFFDRDVLVVWVGQVESFVRAIHAGSWPVWDPSVGFGHPMLGNPNTQVFYPFTWLNLLVRPLRLYVFYVLAHLLLTGVGFYLWGRRLGLSAMAATTGASVWVASGPLLSFGNVWHHLAGAAWLPFVLLIADRALSQGRASQLIRLACVIALQIYAGSPDLCVFTGLVLGADAVRRIGIRERQWRPLLRLLGAYILAVALGAAQILPSLDLALHAGARPLPEEERTAWSLDPGATLQTLLPLSYRELPLQSDTSYLREPFMASAYLGLAAAFLVVWAFFSAKRRLASFYAFLLGASILVALGRHSIVYFGLVAVVPPLGMVRFPSKALIIAALSWAMLAGLGYDAWRASLGSGQPRRVDLRGFRVGLALAFAALVAVVVSFSDVISAAIPLSLGHLALAIVAALTVAALGTLGKSPTSRAALLVPLIVVAELALNNRSVNRTAPSGELDQPPAILSAVPRNPPSRIYVWDYVLRVPGRGHPIAGMTKLFLELSPDPALQLRALQGYLYPPSGARWGLRGSYDRDLVSLLPAWQNQMNLLLRAVEDTPAYVYLLQLGGVDRVVALHRDHPSLPLRAEIPGLLRRPIQVFDVPDPWPRTYFSCGARTVHGTEAMRTLLAPDFDANREVTVDQDVSLPGGCRSGVSRLVDDRPDRVTLDVQSDGPGIAVLLDGAAPGWQVRVDDVPDQILRVNHIFRGVKVSTGHHRVTFVYRPAGILIGAAVSLATALALLAWALTRGRRRVQFAPESPCSGFQSSNR